MSPSVLKVGAPLEIESSNNVFYVEKSVDADKEYGIRITSDSAITNCKFFSFYAGIYSGGWAELMESSSNEYEFYIGKINEDFFFDGVLHVKDDNYANTRIELFELTEADKGKRNIHLVDSLPYSVVIENDQLQSVAFDYAESLKGEPDITIDFLDENDEKIEGDMNNIHLIARNKDDNKLSIKYDLSELSNSILEGINIKQADKKPKTRITFTHAHPEDETSAIKDKMIITSCSKCDYESTKNYFDGSWSLSIPPLFGDPNAEEDMTITLDFSDNLVIGAYDNESNSFPLSSEKPSWNGDNLRFSLVIDGGIEIRISIAIDSSKYKLDSFVSDMSFEVPEQDPIKNSAITSTRIEK